MRGDSDDDRIIISKFKNDVLMSVILTTMRTTSPDNDLDCMDGSGSNRRFLNSEKKAISGLVELGSLLNYEAVQNLRLK